MRARHGDQDAHKKLLIKLEPVVRRMASAYGGRWGQRHNVEDMVQEILLAIHLKLHTYDAKFSFLGWVNAVTRHKLIDQLRRTRSVSISIDHEDVPELVDTANPEAPSVMLDLNKLLQQLKPPAGEIIYALKVEGASVGELAQAHRLTETNVKVIVHRGLQKLSQLAKGGVA